MNTDDSNNTQEASSLQGVDMPLAGLERRMNEANDKLKTLSVAWSAMNMRYHIAALEADLATHEYKAAQEGHIDV